ncbi:MAG: hypothetical protein R3234_13025 [Thermoanaerobaculia bacterium]|nr:hypothetical protein [Thermoanaerobaculia bacterium]
MVLLLLFGLILAGGVAAPLDAQEERSPPVQAQEEPLRLEVLEGGDIAIRLGDLLSDPALVDALESGLPLRLEILTQLWRDGFFDSQVGQFLWRANVFYDVLDQQFVLQVDGPPGGRGTDSEEPSGTDGSPGLDDAGAGMVRTFAGVDELRNALPRVIEPPLGPEVEGRYYYLSRLSVETLSLSDLEELRRWLRGDLAPAISGDGDVEGAAERGLRRTVIRLLGMPTRRFDARTSTFEHSPDEGG